MTPRYIDANKLDTRERGNNSQRTMWHEIERIVNRAPTADVVEVVHGYWIAKPQEFYLGDTEWVCSNCSEEFCLSELTHDEFLIMMQYCPHCGAKMDAKEPNND